MSQKYCPHCYTDLPAEAFEDGLCSACKKSIKITKAEEDSKDETVNKYSKEERKLWDKYFELYLKLAQKDCNPGAGAHFADLVIAERRKRFNT